MGLIRVLIYAFIIYMLYSIIKRAFGGGSKISGSGSSAGEISEMVQDPVCKTYIPRNEAYGAVINGREIMFCSRECAEKYKAEAKQ